MIEQVVLKVVVRLLLPFIFIYAFYIQFHAEVSPGGGFQSGIILAAAFIAYSFVHNLESLQRIIPQTLVRVLSSVGLFIYVGCGVTSMFMGGRFLDYSVFFTDKIQAQKLGVMIVELGIGITVFSVIMIIFYAFGERSGDASE
jgi:multicomponent Na+:H+ antiporter subunit B